MSSSNTKDLPMTIGVFGGSFSPIHLGHALLAITTQQTKSVDRVVLVPVYKHAVKTDLLPFEDRVAMCKLAVAPFSGGEAGNVIVSTVEQEVGESNGAMLQALKSKYPKGSKFLWICGDDFFTWMERPKGIETIQEVSGLIVQRRLHKQLGNSGDRFFKEPLDEGKIRAFGAKHSLEIDFIYGELPHFSSSLVRRAPGNWRSFLPQSVSVYLDERPRLRAMLHASLEAEAALEEQAETNLAGGEYMRRVISSSKMATSSSIAAALVIQGLEIVHALQIERGSTGLQLSMGTHGDDLQRAQASTDAILQRVLKDPGDEQLLGGYDEVLSLAAELKHASTWLARDREIVAKQWRMLVNVGGVDGWTSRLALVQKFNPRIDVLMFATIRALTEILVVAEERANEEHVTDNEGGSPRELSDLLLKWCDCKEALGRLRAFVCAGGPSVSTIVRSSLEMRERLNQTITAKEQSINGVLSQQKDAVSRLAAPDTLYKMLEQVTMWEWSLMGCFASSTPLPLVHKLLARKDKEPPATFDVELFFEAASSAIDLMLAVAKALAASGCARA